MRSRGTDEPRRRRRDELDRAILAWQRTEASADSLSGESKDAIFNEFRRLQATSEQPAAHATLFLPAARWAWGAALPIVALSMLVGSVLLTQGPFDRGDVVVHQPRVEVTKSGDDVVFVIQNGDRTHRISKSTDPGPTGDQEIFTTSTGRFSDRLDSGAGIVYYRID